MLEINVYCHEYLFLAAIETISKVVEGTAASEKGFPEITFMNIFFMFLTN